MSLPRSPWFLARRLWYSQAVERRDHRLRGNHVNAQRKGARRIYRSPELVVFGDLAALTREDVTGPDDGAFGGSDTASRPIKPPRRDRSRPRADVSVSLRRAGHSPSRKQIDRPLAPRARGSSRSAAWAGLSLVLGLCRE